MNYPKISTVKLRITTGLCIFLFFVFFALLFHVSKQKPILLLLLGTFFIFQACKEMLYVFSQTKKINFFSKVFIFCFNIVGFFFLFIYFLPLSEFKIIDMVIYCSDISRYFLLLILIAFIFFLILPNFNARELSINFLITIYITLSISIFLSYFLINKGLLGFYILLIAILNDILAFFIGFYLGKIKIFPKISPKKTLEGYFFGIIIATLVTFLLLSIIPVDYCPFHQSLTSSLFIIIVSCILAQIGDLITSKFKRNYHIKDFSNLFPGHGGFLDRFDSILFLSLCIKCLDLFGFIK